MKKVRLIVFAKDVALVNTIKTGLVRKPYIESIVTVTRPSEAENKLNRQTINVLLWDIDFAMPELRAMDFLQEKYNLYNVYTSIAASRYASVPQNGKNEFLQKPAVFTDMTTKRYFLTMEKHMDSFANRQRQPNMRDMIKMVDLNSKQKIVAIGSSTGGTNALESLLKVLPTDIPPMVVVQHMPSGFTKLFADRLNAIYKQEIKEAQSGDFLMRGRMLIAPADKHMRIIRQQSKLAVECFVGNRIHGVMPAADILFDSVADVVKNEAVGVILTGMGNDGARGLLKMKTAGCQVIGQDEASCVVYGMPKAAKQIGAVTYELPLDRIPEKIIMLSR